MAEDKSRDSNARDVPADPNPPNPPREPNQPRRRRRWPYIVGFVLLCIIIGLVVMAAVLPTVISSDYGTRQLVAMVNQRLRGTVKVQNMNLSWWRPSQLQGVALLDAKDRQVLSVHRVVVQTGLWNIVRSPMSFGQVDLEQPNAIVYLQENESPSLVQAVEPRQPAATQPAKEEKTGPPPAPKGQLVIHSGNVRIIKPDGQELGVTNLNGQVTLDTLDNIQGQLAAQIAQGGQLQAQANVKNLVAGDKIDINQATGQFAFNTDQPVALAPLLSFFDQPGVHGQANLNVQGQLDRGALQADLKTQINEFYTQPKQPRGEQVVQPQPIDLGLVAQVRRLADQKIDGNMNLTGGAGTAKAQFAYAPTTQTVGAGEQPTRVTGEDLMSLLLTGKRVALPSVQATAEANLNLQALAGAIPSLLRIQEGVEITRGELQIPNLQVHTQPDLAAVVAVRVVDLTATRNGQPVDWQPIVLDVNAHVVPNEGLQVERGQLQSGFAQANVLGNPANLNGRFDADLAKLDQQLRQLVDLGDVRMAGRVDGRFTVARENENEVKITSNIKAADLRYISGDRQLNVQQATLNPNASLLLANQSPQRVVLHSLDANVDQRITAAADGWYDLTSKAWKTDVTLQQAQLPYLVSQARALGVRAFDQYEGYSGTISDLQLTAGYNPQTEAIASSGKGTLAGLSVKGQPVAENVALQWQEAQYSTKTQQARLASATLKGDDFASLNAEDFQYQSGQALRLSGRVKVVADVARTLAAVYMLTGQQQAPAIAGQLNLASNMQTQGNVVSLAGEATVDNFQAGTGKEAFRQEQVQLVYDTQIDNSNETIALRQAKLTSAPLTASLAGTVQQFRTRQVLNLQGNYQASWDRIMPLVHELAPATAKTVDLRGKSESRFTVVGPAWQENVQPPYRGVTAEGFDIGWQDGLVYGIKLGRGVLSPRLADGRLVLPTASIPASGGTMNISGTVDLTQQTPQLRIPGQLQLLDNINLNSEIGRQLLSYVNPLFADATGLDGRVSLVIQDIDLPLGEAIKQTGSGRGQMNMQNVRVQPTGAFGLLVQIAGAAGQGKQGRGQQGSLGALGEAGQLGRLGQQVPQGQIDQQGAVDIRIGNPTFVISNGRITYDNFALTFANGVEMVFSGWVGFDDTVMMYVGMPVTAGLLQQAGVKGPVAQYASVLGNARIDVPLVGSRTNPQLDFAHIKIQPLVAQAIRELAKQGIRSAVPGGQFLPLPGEKPPQQGQQREILPGVPVPQLPGLPGPDRERQQEPPPQQQQQDQQQDQQQQQRQPDRPIEDRLRGIFGR